MSAVAVVTRWWPVPPPPSAPPPRPHARDAQGDAPDAVWRSAASLAGAHRLVRARGMSRAVPTARISLRALLPHASAPASPAAPHRSTRGASHGAALRSIASWSATPPPPSASASSSQAVVRQRPAERAPPHSAAVFSRGAAAHEARAATARALAFSVADVPHAPSSPDRPSTAAAQRRVPDESVAPPASAQQRSRSRAPADVAAPRPRSASARPSSGVALEPPRSDAQFARRMQRFCQAHGLPLDARVFAVHGQVPSFGECTRALPGGVWHAADAPNSPFFHLLFVLRRRDVDWSAVWPQQWVSQFPDTHQITSKGNLGATLWEHARSGAGVDVDSFYPRAHVLADGASASAFVDDFRLQAALAVLRRWHRVAASGGVVRAAPLVVRAALDAAAAYLALHHDVDDDVAQVLRDDTLALVRQRVRALAMSGAGVPTASLAAATLGGAVAGAASSATLYAQVLPSRDWDLVCRAAASPHVPLESTAAVSAPATPVAGGPQRLESSSIVLDVTPTVSVPRSPHARRSASRRRAAPSSSPALPPQPAQTRNTACDDECGAEHVLTCVERVLLLCEQLRPQPEIDADENVWILKPAVGSRAQGIALARTLEDAWAHQRAHTAPYIAQKYIERPLLVHERKFDVRQWVLLTSVTPLRVYIYDECYIRFCAEKFALRDTSATFQHLSNNAVQKHCTGSARDEATSVLGDGLMWTEAQMESHLRTRFAHRGDAWRSVVRPAIRRIVTHSLRAAQQVLEHRPCSFELFGFDLLLDARLHVWLLEINKSPSLEASTPVTARLCAEVVRDTVDLVTQHLMRGDAQPATVGGWQLLVGDAAPSAIDAAGIAGAACAGAPQSQSQPLRCVGVGVGVGVGTDA